MNTRHHRKPRSKGGTDNTENISIVDKRKHEHFHTMFGNMDAVEVVKELNKNYLHGLSSELTKKKIHAWNKLFGSKSLKEITDELLNIWLEPNITLRIVRKPFITLQWE